MKKFRIIGMALVAIIMGVSFASCNPDDKKEEPTKKLVKLSYDVVEYTFRYDDQGRLIESVETQNTEDPYNEVFTYVWGENTIDFKHYINGMELTKRTIIFENGLVTKLDSVYPFFDSTYTYNSSGRIVESESFFGTNSFKWNNDKLIEKKNVSSSSTNIMTYTYETNATTKGYNPLISWLTVEHLFTVHPELAGIKTQQLYNSVTHYSKFNDDGKEYEYTFNYKYEFDEDGYVNKAIVTYDTEEGEVVSEIYTMIWE